MFAARVHRVPRSFVSRNSVVVTPRCDLTLRSGEGGARVWERDPMPQSAADHERIRFDVPDPSSAPSLNAWPSVDMARVMATIDIVAPRRVPVLITGETGVGKE